jgi:UDP-N-acetylglucosamine--N-acetylmuramyl-(pentapeptide) pyrophosphoryl-undecaprenol N-acetylglucosamine transferase
MHANAEPHKKRTPRTLLIAGGGTGGHLFPALAIAEEYCGRSRGNQVCFISAGTALEHRVLPPSGFDFHFIKMEGIKGRGLFKGLQVLVRSLGWVIAAINHLQQIKPGAVLGVGGYSAGPVLLGAWLMRKPIVLHEQNRLPGITNRLLAPLARRVYTSFESTQALLRSKQIKLVGNPVRRSIRLMAQSRKEPGEAARQASSAASMPTGQAEHAEDRATGSFKLLITGGSQGAHGINQAVVEALPDLARLQGLYCMHQTGNEDQAWVAQAYRERKVAAEVKAFFTDMAARYQNADLIICRAGATTIAEITALGKAALFVPFPYAADDHQTLNARELQKRGAADMLAQSELSGRRLSRCIASYVTDPPRRQRMARRAAALGRPEAARDLVDDLYRLMGWPPDSDPRKFSTVGAT